MGLLSELKSNSKYLSPIEKRIAEQVLNAPKEFISLTATELSKKADVSQGSINNFSKKFAGGGFSELKLKIATELERFGEVNGKSENRGIVNERLENLCTCLRHTAELNDEKLLKKVAEKIIKARRVEIYGVYKSGLVAQDFCYQLIQLGIPAANVTDMLMCAVSAASVDKNCVVIAISVSGETRETVQVARIAKEHGAFTVALTANKFSPLANAADCTLLSASEESFQKTYNDSRSSQMFVLDSISELIIKAQPAFDDSRHGAIQKILESHRIEEL